MELINITKKYGNKVIFKNFSYAFEDGKITVILGDSGVGKTTLINIMLGFTDYEGEVKNDRKIACVFQNDRLIPNLSVKDNLLLVNNNIDIDNELSKVEMLDAKNLKPNNLSAGMSRRVAIIRAMNYPADILLMDEPLRNLDYYMKYKIMEQIKDYHKKITTQL
ncbi:MAG: ATP-binding cassette domain-containing protein [Christensenellales bacterium]